VVLNNVNPFVAVSELSTHADALTVARMEPVMNGDFKQMWLGSMLLSW
jgi:hypothetical protein